MLGVSQVIYNYFNCTSVQSTDVQIICKRDVAADSAPLAVSMTVNGDTTDLISTPNVTYPRSVLIKKTGEVVRHHDMCNYDMCHSDVCYSDMSQINLSGVGFARDIKVSIAGVNFSILYANRTFISAEVPILTNNMLSTPSLIVVSSYRSISVSISL